jgi:ribonucleoside-triphosphate reductase (formate)
MTAWIGSDRGRNDCGRPVLPTRTSLPLLSSCQGLFLVDHIPSVRASILTRRTYCRPLDDEGTRFETWPQVVDRVLSHQRWLWERAQGGRLRPVQEEELVALVHLILQRKCLPAGRVLWLGGTEIVKRRPASNFNCAFNEIQSVHDIVDIFWLLLQGCGTGFKPVNGVLSGFSRKIEVSTIPSERTERGGAEANVETYDPESGVWTIRVGDSAEAWAKAAGKLVVGRYPAKRLVLDYSEIRPAGSRLRGYGWICSGDAQLAKAFTAIAMIRNRRVGKLLTKIDLLDIVNWLGTVLSTRRSAQACLMDHGDPEWEAFANAKPPGYWEKNPQRAQSNNGLCFWEKPSTREIRRIFDMMIAHGGAEPSFNNAAAARKRAPWFAGFNPCFEVLNANRGFCNLIDINLDRFHDDNRCLHEATWIMARANYRQTLVDLRDGVLQSAWHENNEFLRLCGVGITGIVQRPDLDYYAFRQLDATAIAGAYSMADELGTERPKNVTTVKPSGTSAKICDCTEGAHKPLGRYIFNNVAFGRHDPLVPTLFDANYRIVDHPTDPTAVLITLPVEWKGVPFETVRGVPINQESAIAQLERYRMLMDAWCDQNVSVTVSYDPGEVPAMVKWFERNWDSYVGVSFLFRNDPTKTAQDLGFAYLPQNVVSESEFVKYTGSLKPVDLEAIEDDQVREIDAGIECPGGACPVK